MNSVILSGAIATEPEMRYTPNGKAVVNLRLGVGSGRKSQQSGKEFVDYFTVVAWGDLAESAASALQKGDRAIVQGRLGNESYNGQDGKKRWVTKVTASSIEKLMPAEAAEEGGHDISEARDIDPDDVPD